MATLRLCSALVGITLLGLPVSTKSFLLSKSKLGDGIKIRSETIHFPLKVSSGFFFEEGGQALASLQKPLGLILEEEIDAAGLPSVFVTEVLPGSSSASAGLAVGDVVIAVQNVNMKGQNLENVMTAIQQAPKVLNIRVQRKNT